VSKLYRVIGPCEVAGVAPGGTVTREQVEGSAGPDGVIRFEVLLGPHLEEVTDQQDQAEPKRATR